MGLNRDRRRSWRWWVSDFFDFSVVGEKEIVENVFFVNGICVMVEKIAANQ